RCDNRWFLSSTFAVKCSEAEWQKCYLKTIRLIALLSVYLTLRKYSRPISLSSFTQYRFSLTTVYWSVSLTPKYSYSTSINSGVHFLYFIGDFSLSNLKG